MLYSKQVCITKLSRDLYIQHCNNYWNFFFNINISNVNTIEQPVEVTDQTDPVQIPDICSKFFDD